MLGSTYTVGKPGSLRVRKQYYDEYSYLSLGVLQAQTWLSTRFLYNFDKNNDVDGRRQDQRNSARTLSARANVQKFPSYILYMGYLSMHKITTEVLQNG